MTTRILQLSVLFAVVSAAFAQDAGNSAKQYISISRPANAATLPFSDAVLVGRTLYLSGRIGLDPKTGQAPADVDTEIKLLLDGIGDILQKAGMSWDDLVSVTVYSTDLNLYGKFNDAYKSKFSGQFPARAFLGVASILRGGHFEITGVAVKAVSKKK